MFQNEGKYQTYLELIQNVQDPSGFLESQECDSLLFSGLIGCVPGVKVDIKAAYDKFTDTWHRRPLKSSSCCDCWNPKDPENQIPLKTKLKTAFKEILKNKRIDSAKLQKILSYKGSTISRDMLTGLAFYAWYNKRLDISEDVISHALSNWGVMGEGDPWRINIMPPLFATFCWISFRLGGPSRAWARWIPADSGAKVDGYKAHLQVLHILLRQELESRRKSKDQHTLNYQAARQPRNPLFLHAVGRDLEALEILSDERLWPSGRLPMRADRKTQWIPMRDEGEDWAGVISSTEGFKHHSGGDFIFIYWLICRKYKIGK